VFTHILQWFGVWKWFHNQILFQHTVLLTLHKKAPKCRRDSAISSHFVPLFCQRCFRWWLPTEAIVNFFLSYFGLVLVSVSSIFTNLNEVYKFQYNFKSLVCLLSSCTSPCLTYSIIYVYVFTKAVSLVNKIFLSVCNKWNSTNLHKLMMLQLQCSLS